MTHGGTDNFYTSSNAAQLLKVSVGTIQKLVDSNQLHAWKTEGGHRRISKPSLDAFAKSNNMLSFIGRADRENSILKVLVVDDDPIALDMFKNFCSNSGFPIECIAMSSGLEALIDIDSIQPNILIADLNMPGVDGFQLLRTIKEMPRFSRLVCVASSSLTPQEIEKKGGLPDGTVYFAKPMNHHWINGFLTAIANGFQAREKLLRQSQA